MFSKIWLLICWSIPTFLHAVPDVSVQVHRFRSGENYLAEISLYIVANSLTCDAAKHNEYGAEYVVLIQDADSNIVAGNRYRLAAPGCALTDLIDVKRFILPEGQYFVEVEITDINDAQSRITIGQSVEIVFDEYSIHLSDVQLHSVIRRDSSTTHPLYRNGLYLEPLPYNYYYSTLDKLHVYVETYDLEKIEGQPYLQYTIKPLTGSIPEPIIAYRKAARQSVSGNVFQLDIKDMISGPYLFEAALFDGNKNPVTSRSTSFSRYNPKGDSMFVASGALNLEASFIKKISEDSLDYYLKAMTPVVSSIEADIMNGLLEKGNAKSKQFFIHKYWTDQAGKFADVAFSKYMAVAKVVDEIFRSGFGYGFETDRGHIFLKYGTPDDVIEVEDEPSAPPYEIWFYYDFPATRQNNVRFLFYNPSLARNAFELLHSTAIGEVKNERWEVELYKDATLETPGVNEKTMGDNVHRNARKYFENY